MGPGQGEPGQVPDPLTPRRGARGGMLQSRAETQSVQHPGGGAPRLAHGASVWALGGTDQYRVKQEVES